MMLKDLAMTILIFTLPMKIADSSEPLSNLWIVTDPFPALPRFTVNNQLPSPPPTLHTLHTNNHILYIHVEYVLCTNRPTGTIGNTDTASKTHWMCLIIINQHRDIKNLQSLQTVRQCRGPRLSVLNRRHDGPRAMIILGDPSIFHVS